MERSKWWGVWRAEFKIIIQKEKEKKRYQTASRREKLIHLVLILIQVFFFSFVN